MKRVVIISGSEMRHTYFRIRLSNDSRFEITRSFCEGTEKSLEAITFARQDSTFLERQHVLARTKSEEDFFSEVSTQLQDHSNHRRIRKGEINDESIVREIIDLEPDILVCYGSSLIKSELLQKFEKRFLNVHLGLSPYYRGSGTNVWPLINREPFMVGATFMYIDRGIDTGAIIHQIRADIFLGDSPHTIGNRLIKKMTNVYADILANFDDLTNQQQPEASGKLYKIKDFNSASCETLYKNFSDGLVEEYLSQKAQASYPYIVQNPILM